MTNMIQIRRGTWDARASVQGIANTVADMLTKTIGEQDPAMMAMLQGELRTIRGWIIAQNKSPKVIFEKLQDVHRQIAEFQYRGVENAAEIMRVQATEFADVIARHEAKALEVMLNERNIRQKRINILSDRQIENMFFKPFVQGRTIEQWFTKLKHDNANAIFYAVQKGIVDGLTLNSIMQVIRGTKANDFKDGILSHTKVKAEMLARTCINAVANQSRLEMYKANDDVIDGVRWLATLDHRTCMICGAYDRKIWTPDKISEVVTPPAHISCRCILIPHIDIGDGVDRPAEAENFDKLAQEAYEKKYPGKKYDDLSYEYRRKLRYGAIKEYGRDKAYKKMPYNTTFADYLKSQPESFQKEWLGAKRYEMYKDGKLPLEHLLNPDKKFKKTIADLERELGIKESVPTIVATEPAIMPMQVEYFESKIKEVEEQYRPIIAQAKQEAEEARKVLEEHCAKWGLAVQDDKIVLVSLKHAQGNDTSFIDHAKKLLKECQAKDKVLNGLTFEEARAKDVALDERAKAYIRQLFPKERPANEKREVFADVVVKSKSVEFKKEVEAAVEYMDRIMYNAGYTDGTKYTIIERKTGKTYYDQNKKEIRINTTEPGWFESLMHEMAHGLSYNVPELREELNDFLADIETGKVLKAPTSKAVGYKETIIPMPSWYCTRIYNKNEVEELLAMWITCLTGDTTRRRDMNKPDILQPEDFAKHFPQYFNAILKILRK